MNGDNFGYLSYSGLVPSRFGTGELYTRLIAKLVDGCQVYLDFGLSRLRTCVWGSSLYLVGSDR